MKSAGYYSVLLSLLIFATSCSHAPFTLHSTNSDVPPVQITLMKGQIKTSNNTLQNFTPIHFTLASYQCKKINLQTPQSNLQIKACYRENAVTLDTAIFNYIPLWKQGFVYHNVSSTNLTGMDIMIQLGA